MGKYTIKEKGNNGSVEVRPDKIVRTINKRLARDEYDVIAMSSVRSVDRDRQIGGDVITVRRRGGKTFRWKIDGDKNAKKLVREISDYARL